MKFAGQTSVQVRIQLFATVIMNTLDFRFPRRRVWRWQPCPIQRRVGWLAYTDCGGSTHLWNIICTLSLSQGFHWTSLNRNENYTINLVEDDSCRSRGSSVSIVSGYGLDDREIGVRSSGETEDFFPWSLCPDRSVANPNSCTMGTGGPLPGLKRGRGVTLSTDPHTVPRLRRVGAVPPLPSLARLWLIDVLRFISCAQNACKWISRTWRVLMLVYLGSGQSQWPAVLLAVLNNLVLQQTSSIVLISFPVQITRDCTWITKLSFGAALLFLCFCPSFKRWYRLAWEPGTSGSIVSDYGVHDWAIEVQSPAEAKGFFL
jgi:hypothetical protein